MGIVFTAGGPFSETQNTLSGQAQKVIFKLNKYLYKFTFIPPKHKLELFDKLITPILTYGSEICGVYSGKFIRKGAPTILQTITWGQKSTQNDFVYGELGLTTLITKRYLVIVKYWFKILMSNDNKYINLIYRMMLSDMESSPSTVNWSSLVKHILLSLGFYEVWLAQGVGNYNAFISIFKQRLTDTFIQNWHSRIQSPTRAVFIDQLQCFNFSHILKKSTSQNFQKFLVDYVCHHID